MTSGLGGILARVFCATLPVRLGSVAAILDKWGGVRVVVTTDDRTFAAQLSAERDEQAYVVPGFLEPMYVTPPGYPGIENGAKPAWGRGAEVVERATAELEQSQPSACGSCRQCCKVLFVADEGDGFTKPSQSWCRHICGAGCGIYETRPRTCRAFECVWLRSQRGNRAMPAELRPDRCGAILTDHDEGAVRVHVDPDKPRSSALRQFLEQRAGEGESFEEATRYHGERR